MNEKQYQAYLNVVGLGEGMGESLPSTLMEDAPLSWLEKEWIKNEVM